jgi:TFIIF-interacting CTD phosphatase-like protein
MKKKKENQVSDSDRARSWCESQRQLRAQGWYPSPLDSDFFDLLQRLEPAQEDLEAVQSVLEQVSSLPQECWRSMERAFYTLHLRPYLAEKLTSPPGRHTYLI